MSVPIKLRSLSTQVGAALVLLSASCFCAPRAPVSPELANLCAKAMACSELSYRTVGDCVWQQSQLPPGWKNALLNSRGPIPSILSKVATRACLTAAKTCASVKQCFVPVSQCLPDGTGGDGCSLVYEGSSCIANEGGYHMCGQGSCDAKELFPCQGDRVLFCDSNNGLAFDCRTYFGDFCPVKDRGTPETSCGTKGSACQKRPCANGADHCPQVWCEDDDVVYCDSATGDARLHCAASPLDGTCSENKCVPGLFSGCDPNTFLDSCEGSSLVYCDGERRSIDCTSIGFSKCATHEVGDWRTSEDDSDKVSVARCQ